MGEVLRSPTTTSLVSFYIFLLFFLHSSTTVVPGKRITLMLMFEFTEAQDSGQWADRWWNLFTNKHHYMKKNYNLTFTKTPIGFLAHVN
jgi:hypothetical protein